MLLLFSASCCLNFSTLPVGQQFTNFDTWRPPLTLLSLTPPTHGSHAPYTQLSRPLHTALMPRTHGSHTDIFTNLLSHWANLYHQQLKTAAPMPLASALCINCRPSLFLQAVGSGIRHPTAHTPVDDHKHCLFTMDLLYKNYGITRTPTNGQTQGFWTKQGALDSRVCCRRCQMLRDGRMVHQETAGTGPRHLSCQGHWRLPSGTPTTNTHTTLSLVMWHVTGHVTNH